MQKFFFNMVKRVEIKDLLLIHLGQTEGELEIIEFVGEQRGEVVVQLDSICAAVNVTVDEIFFTDFVTLQTSHHIFLMNHFAFVFTEHFI